MVQGVGLRAKQDAWKNPRQNTHEQKTLKNVQEKKHLEMSPSEPSVPRKIPALSQGTQTQLKPPILGVGGVPREQKMLQGHLPRVIHHQVY
jgi:hypothetical protein